jgi:hypothetical protein
MIGKVLKDFLDLLLVLVFKNQSVKSVLREMFVLWHILFFSDLCISFLGFILLLFDLFWYLSDGRVKSVFNLILSPSAHVLCDLAPGLPKLLVEWEDLFVVFVGPRPLFDLWIQYVTPAIPALGSRFVYEKFRCLLPLNRSPALHPVDEDLIFFVGPETASSFALLLLFDNAINVTFNPCNIIVVNNFISEGINHIHALVVGELDFLSNQIFLQFLVFSVFKQLEIFHAG